ncbi:unannotated protein [freshwater metagenome]|uniref:Unannotated protein n=1 Tax=freshwater metagenome TaxID=449393 RepID=A0A6J6F022_9ZZZZ
MTCALLVTDQNVADFVRRHQLVIERHDGATWQTKYILDAKELQALENCAGSGQHRCLGGKLGFSLFLWAQLRSLGINEVQTVFIHGVFHYILLVTCAKDSSSSLQRPRLLTSPVSGISPAHRGCNEGEAVASRCGGLQVRRHRRVGQGYEMEYQPELGHHPSRRR